MDAGDSGRDSHESGEKSLTTKDTKVHEGFPLLNFSSPADVTVASVIFIATCGDNHVNLC